MVLLLNIFFVISKFLKMFYAVTISESNLFVSFVSGIYLFLLGDRPAAVQRQSALRSSIPLNVLIFGLNFLLLQMPLQDR